MTHAKDVLGMSSDEIDRLRSDARQLAVEIVRLIARRREVVARIGELKRSMGLDVVQPDVEAGVRAEMLKEAEKHGVPPETVNRLATLLFADSVEKQSGSKQTLTHLDILRRAVELQRSGRDVQRLEVGEPDLGAPREVRESVANAVLEGFARYVDSWGIAELRQAIAAGLQEDYGAEVMPENIVVTPGGRFAIFVAVKTLLREGDELLVIDPSWPMYRQVASFVGARSVHVKTRFEEGWTPSVEEIEKHISSATKAILLNYPNNPTGKILDRKTFRKIVELAEQRNLVVVSDEVYSDYVKQGHVSVLDGVKEMRHVLIQSFSKSFGMTGYRIGYVVADKSLTSKMASINSLLITCVPEFIQRGAIQALRMKNAPKHYAQIMMRRMELAVQELEKVGLPFYRPDGGMYVFPKVGRVGGDGMKMAFDLLESKGVAVAPGSIFGGYDEFIRISLGAHDEAIVKGIRLLGEFLREKGSK